MSDELKPERPSGDTHAHSPLPYRVRLRITLSSDESPLLVERSVVSYSLFEAIMQVSLEITGEAGRGEVKVELIEPDLPAYYRMLSQVLSSQTEAKHDESLR